MECRRYKGIYIKEIGNKASKVSFLKEFVEFTATATHNIHGSTIYSPRLRYHSIGCLSGQITVTDRSVLTQPTLYQTGLNCINYYLIICNEHVFTSYGELRIKVSDGHKQKLSMSWELRKLCE